MIRSYNVYPKNKIGNGLGIFQFPLKQTNSFTSGKTKKYDNYKSAFPKSKKIKKLIEEINSSNKPIINNNPNDMNDVYKLEKLLMEEKTKNNNLYENIIQLNNHIEELESQLHCKCQHHIVNDEIIMLRKENQELRLFKQKVYEFSMRYDEVNKDILLCLKNIEKAVELFNINYPNNNSIENKNITMEKITENYNSIISDLSNFLKIKEDEYNTLLMEKENEINKLKFKLNDINNINKFSEDVKYNNEYQLDNYNENTDYRNNFLTNSNYKPYITNNSNLGNEKDPISFKGTFENNV